MGLNIFRRVPDTKMAGTRGNNHDEYIHRPSDKKLQNLAYVSDKSRLEIMPKKRKNGRTAR
jgi:hypothetical protein